MPNVGIVKYHVKMKFDVDGIVEKADIIGAIFGQTEGLLGPELNLNELQKVSKVGRIEVSVENKADRTFGNAILPMSTDISKAALIAAAVESIDKVGPFQAKFSLTDIEDIREIKKKVIVDRAKKIVQEWATKTMSESEEMLKNVYGATKPGKLSTFGREQLACGSGIYESNWIILVEGRADVINLLRAGFDNSIGIEGSRIPEAVVHLCKEKQRVIAFLDGDRAGDLILKELEGTVKIDVIVRAYAGREVEELTPKDIVDILKDHVQVEHTETNVKPIDDGGFTSKVSDIFKEINETLEATVLDDSMNELFRVPVSEIVQTLQDGKDMKYLVLDGIITQRLVDTALKTGVQFVVGHRITDLKKGHNLTLRTFDELGIN
ncbi:MAG TPA: toprim domain-containing protein [Nitrososphaerales archaeon]|nr:toprim domain-containing protein [Nitrososphaerota archaeon]HIM82449.1 toprim domain-containing protein [Nitrososphaerales archaeon]